MNECATKTEFQDLIEEMRAERREMELRMTVRWGVMLAVTTVPQIAIFGFLLALFTGVLP